MTPSDFRAMRGARDGRVALRLLAFLCCAGCEPKCAPERRPGEGGPLVPSGFDTAAARETDGGAALEACARLAGVQCDLERRCFGGWLLRRLHGTEAACLDALSKSCVDKIEVPRTGYSPSSMEACASALAQLSCEAFANIGSLAEPHCRTPPGQLGIGDACRFDDQCQSRRCVFPWANQSSRCGVCQPLLAEGSDCRMAPNLCDEGLSCVSGRCIGHVIEEGAQCNERDLPCSFDRGLFCIAGRCRYLGTKVGSPCDPKHIVAPNCQFRTGLYCDRATRECKAIGLAKLGQPCGSEDLMCEAPTACMERGTGRQLKGAIFGRGVCESPWTVGKPCDFTGTSPPCAGGLTCTDEHLCGPAPYRKMLAAKCRMP